MSGADPIHRHRAAALPATQRGFTLVEVMIVAVVVSILATIAYPMFTQQLVKANRSAAQSFMLDVASRQERYLLDARGYTDTLGAGGLNVSIPADVASVYKIDLVADNAATPPVYTITAVPLSGTRQANDGILSLDSFGMRVPAEKWQ